jgi:hypothetical protein
MSQSVRFYRTECNISYFGNVMLELKDTGLRIVSRDNPGEIHSFTWEQLRAACRCDSCTKGDQIKGEFV